MRPKKPETTGEGDLLRARLDQTINLKHERPAARHARIGFAIFAQQALISSKLHRDLYHIAKIHHQFVV
jgi:hypothetical protein